MNILLVEPSAVIHRILSHVMTARGDRLHAVESGTEALEFLSGNEDIDLLITRLVLADMDGIELCWRVRANMPRFATLHIIAMSTNTDKLRLAEALDAGADDYLELPFCETELHARLRSSERAIFSQREITRLATTDEMTGIFNRRAFLHEVDQSIANLALEIPTSLAILDIDHFKGVNDAHGHDVGDTTIRAVCDSFSGFEGILGRLGGEEFAWLLPGFEAQTAREACDDARMRIAALEIAAGGRTISVTASFGLTRCQPGETTIDVLKRADLALYDAKRAGRNRVEVTLPEDLPEAAVA